MEKTEITSSEHLLPFDRLSPDQFELLCFKLISAEGYESVQHRGGTGDGGVDIVAKKEEKYTIFQAKRWESINAAALNKEIDKISKEKAEKYFGDFNKLIFMISSKISPSCSNDVIKYGKTKLSNVEILFWAISELDEKVKKHREIELEFFKGGISEERIVDGVVKKLINIIGTIEKRIKKIIEKAPINRITLNNEIESIKPMINDGQHEEALIKLRIMLDKIKDLELNSEISRIYNNIGVCIYKRDFGKSKLDSAIDSFKKAFQYDADNIKSKINYILTVYNNKNDNLYREAHDLAKELWKTAKGKEQNLIYAYWFSFQHNETPENIIKVYEENKDLNEATQQDSGSLNIISTAYLMKKQFSKAYETVEKAIELAPSMPFNYVLKANIIMAKVQTEKAIYGPGTITPKFSDYKDINDALVLLEKSLDLLKDSNEMQIIENTKADILTCAAWLNLANTFKYTEMRRTINNTLLGDKKQHQVLVINFDIELKNKNFEIAYEIIHNSPHWPVISLTDKLNVATAFFKYGAIEQAKNILEEMAKTSNFENDILYWSNLSYYEILLNNKNEAIRAAQHLKEMTSGTKDEEQAINHFSVIMLRYAKQNEVDRLMGSMLEHDKKFPEKPIMHSIKAIDEKGDLTDELKNYILKAQEDHNTFRDKFKRLPLFSYHMEEALHRTYSDILINRGDPEFTIEYTIPDPNFEKEIWNNFKNSEALILDYSFLLNLAKMECLGYLEKFGKKILISEALFEKMQYDLIQNEYDELRKAWNYIRKSRNITILKPNIEQMENVKELKTVFDTWIIETINIAQGGNVVVLSDDLKFMTYLKNNQKIKTCNSIVVLKEILSCRWIDEKMFSLCIGDLAERFYTFLSMTADNLFQIAIEDEGKITLRTYHLVNQLFLPGSVPQSFSKVFVGFIDKIWKSGVLPETKYNWLEFFTRAFIRLIENQGGAKTKEEIEIIIPDFSAIWIIAIENSNKEELILLNNKIPELLTKQYFEGFKKVLNEKINVKQKYLGENK